LRKPLAVRGEDGVVTIVERQLDFEGAIVLQFGRAIARDLVAFVEAAPSEKNDSSAVFDFGGGLDGTEGKFCSTVTTHEHEGAAVRPAGRAKLVPGNSRDRIAGQCGRVTPIFPS
jgi:hypothetical protein